MTELIINILGNITQIIEQYSYLIIFLFMTIESSFVPFPSELVMIPAGYLVAKGSLSLSMAILSGILGSIAGAMINYYLAKTLGNKFINKYGKFFLLPEHKFVKIKEFFNKHGAISTFSGRLVPGLRQYISLPAGLSNMSLKKFTFYTFLGSGIWMVVLTLIGVFFGHNQELIHDNLKPITLLALMSVTILILSYALRQRIKARIH